MADVHFDFSILLGMRNSPTDCGIFGITRLVRISQECGRIWNILVHRVRVYKVVELACILMPLQSSAKHGYYISSGPKENYNTYFTAPFTKF